jgi:hypothetical protein
MEPQSSSSPTARTSGTGSSVSSRRREATLIGTCLLLVGVIIGLAFSNLRRAEAQSTFPIPQELYINANVGNDNSACVPTAPCKTIAHATALAAQTSPVASTAVNIHASPGIYNENVVLRPDINLVCTVPQAVGPDVGSCQMGGSASNTVTADLAAFNASPDAAPGAQIVGFSVVACLDFDLYLASQEGFIYSTNTTFTCTGTDQIIGEHTAVGLVTFGGYIQDGTLSLSDGQIQTWATPFIGSTITDVATNNENTLSFYSSPLGATSPIAINLTATASSAGTILWTSQASPTGLATATVHGSGSANSVEFFTTDPIMTNPLFFTGSGVDFPVIRGDWLATNFYVSAADQVISTNHTATASALVTPYTNVDGLQASGLGPLYNEITTATGTVDLNTAQAGYPFQLIVASLTGALTVNFPNSSLSSVATWFVSTEGVTFNSHAITLECGTASTTKTVNTNVLETCFCDGSNNFYCNP